MFSNAMNGFAVEAIFHGIIKKSLDLIHISKLNRCFIIINWIQKFFYAESLCVDMKFM